MPEQSCTRGVEQDVNYSTLSLPPYRGTADLAGFSASPHRARGRPPLTGQGSCQRSTSSIVTGKRCSEVVAYTSSGHSSGHRTRGVSDAAACPSASPIWCIIKCIMGATKRGDSRADLLSFRSVKTAVVEMVATRWRDECRLEIRCSIRLSYRRSRFNLLHRLSLRRLSPGRVLAV